VLGPEAFVQGDEVGGQTDGGLRPARFLGCQLGVDGDVGLGDGRPEAAAFAVEAPALGFEGQHLVVEGLTLAHRREHLVLEQASALVQQVTVGLHGLQLARDGHRSRVEAPIDLGDTGLDRRQVVLEAGLDADGVVPTGRRVNQGSVGSRAGVLEVSQLRQLGQGLAPVAQPVNGGVVALDDQELGEDSQ